MNRMLNLKSYGTYPFDLLIRFQINSDWSAIRYMLDNPNFWAIFRADPKYGPY